MIGYRMCTVGLTAVALLTVSCSSLDPSMSAPKAESAPIVTVETGRLQGSVEGPIQVFRGVPYAAPPVGKLRWRPPIPAPAWPGVKDATEFGAACIQPTARVQSIYAQDIGPTSEDCLTLNVWAPANAKDAPVLVWIHGGALRTGSSKEPFYDGAKLARRDLVVVSVNYRLGVLGYLAHPQLSGESALGISGNYGLLDQIAALRWVKDNIKGFGGDANNITIAGESAGALSVMYLLATPSARVLFDKAILQSAYMISTPELERSVHGEIAAEEAGKALSAKLGVADIQALRSVDAQKMTDDATAAGFAPWAAIDGRVLKKQLVETFERGEQSPVPILVGFNSGEIRSLSMLAPPAPASAAEYQAAIRKNYGDLAEQYLRLYPSTDMLQSNYANTRDALYGWTSERLARNQTAIGQPAYLYLFDHGYPAADEAGLHAFHAAEIPYVFGTFDRTPPRWPKNPQTAAENRYSDAMIDYWASFARTGTPSAHDQPAWQAYGIGRAYMHFADDAPRPARNLMPGMYELHEEAVRRRRADGTLPWHWNTGLWSPPLAEP
ncbi:MAG: carboxylesterase family protein [Pseudoxanthomonas sp.]